MITRIDVLAQRRAELIGDIAAQRDRTAAVIATLRTQLAIASVGLLASRLLRRTGWLPRLAIAAAAAAATLPIVARLVAARR
jgi:hypothetical protein